MAQALIISEIRFLCEGVAEILGRAQGIHVCGQIATLSKALAHVATASPDIILLDAAFPEGTTAATQLAAAAPRSLIIALALAETEEAVVAWAEAGVVGYIPKTASAAEVVSMIEQISRGEQTCTSRVAGSLLRRIATGIASSAQPAAPVLTRRETQILRLIGDGLSNKDIARRLGITLGTTKSHVHNLLGKLSFQRRAQVMTQAHHRASERPALNEIVTG
jgi:two-component system, NarL family, nitrate/nitrite response regulator NarL